jgi:hypothetical protein
MSIHDHAINRFVSLIVILIVVFHHLMVILFMQLETNLFTILNKKI